MWWWWWWGGGEGGGGDDNDGDDIMMLMRTMTLVIVMIVITMMIVIIVKIVMIVVMTMMMMMMGCISNKTGNIWSNTCSPTLITLMITTTILTTYVVTWWLFKTTTLMANHNISLIIYNHYFLSTLPCLSLKCVVRTSAPHKFLQLQSQGLFQVRTRREWWLKPWFKNGGNPWNSGKVKASEMVAEHMVQPSMGWWNWDDLWILGCVSW